MTRGNKGRTRDVQRRATGDAGRSGEKIRSTSDLSNQGVTSQRDHGDIHNEKAILGANGEGRVGAEHHSRTGESSHRGVYQYAERECFVGEQQQHPPRRGEEHDSDSLSSRHQRQQQSPPQSNMFMEEAQPSRGERSRSTVGPNTYYYDRTPERLASRLNNLEARLLASSGGGGIGGQTASAHYGGFGGMIGGVADMGVCREIGAVNFSSAEGDLQVIDGCMYLRGDHMFISLRDNVMVSFWSLESCQILLLPVC